MKDIDGKRELALRDEWMLEAKSCTLEGLPAFIEKMVGFEHGYGTICNAVAAAGVAAMSAVDRSPSGGITGFQAGCVMWGVIEGWGSFDAGPKRMFEYKNMLSPQCRDRFQKSISKGTWKWLQGEAKKRLDEDVDGLAHEDVSAHWNSIASGKVPFGYFVEDE